MLSSGNDVNARDDNDHTCLHAAACSGSVTHKIMLLCRVNEYCYRPSDGVYFEKKTALQCRSAVLYLLFKSN